MKKKQNKEVEVKRKKIDKTQLAIKIIASILAVIFIGSMFTTAIFYIIG